MSPKLLAYIEKDSWIHRLTGSTKLLCFLMWSMTAMLSYDTRVLMVMLFLSYLMFKISRIDFKEIAFVFYFILAFLVINNIAVFLFSPYEGVHIYHTRHDLVKLIGPYTLTWEQLFYQFNMTLKYLTIIPIGLIFLATTHPSEFAASLNKIGVSYKIAYSVAIAMRYIPDIQRDFIEISQAQQARGIDLSRNEKLLKRLKNMGAILMPLVLTSLDRIETISYAMELRSFGKYKKRTFYSERPFRKQDGFALLGMGGLMILFLWITFSNGSRFYNPFL
ncbi:MULTISPECIES: energy-coupling factor transporter transmembrane component T family protein [unclassified Turicibacter]|uniref:energy-coupling factor transporter transmembrane component T family protein n=1 Tax=unclassified Turicibacter TaxID=2638206 RepID=UPI00137B005C|nr:MULTISPECIES: energy-coupling factor transporter transmembrane component T [unclassified Turicibacter]MCU7204316.1 energy-coupling factor transporter transmembrane protein EcfT [Turicibacter sp. TA25]NCE79029.1 energy-coupling factor transporter transmembrane protein EcfT [Turicibacter sp. TS3]